MQSGATREGSWSPVSGVVINRQKLGEVGASDTEFQRV